MMNFEPQPANHAERLETIADLYPLAFALVSASNSKAGRTLHQGRAAGSPAPPPSRDRKSIQPHSLLLPAVSTTTTNW